MFCTYLTIYKGNKLPPFYIGSTSVSKIQNGYRGSVSSREYKNIWRNELRNNPSLFKTIIISTHLNRKDAILKENKFHVHLKVVQCSLYLNRANAIPNGVFGINSRGKNNPMFGKKRNDAKIRMTVDNPMKNRLIAEKVAESKRKLRELGLHKSTRSSDEILLITSQRMLKFNPSSIKCSCIVCHKETNLSSITRHHVGCKINERK